MWLSHQKNIHQLTSAVANWNWSINWFIKSNLKKLNFSLNRRQFVVPEQRSPLSYWRINKKLWLCLNVAKRQINHCETCVTFAKINPIRSLFLTNGVAWRGEDAPQMLYLPGGWAPCLLMARSFRPLFFVCPLRSPLKLCQGQREKRGRDTNLEVGMKQLKI